MPNDRPDVFDANCGSREVLALVADRWSMLVIYALRGEVRRHSELRRTIGGISQKMLTQTLRALERDGLVLRRDVARVPRQVEYELTALGKTLLVPLGAICRWAEEHLPQVRAARSDSELARRGETSAR